MPPPLIRREPQSRSRPVRPTLGTGRPGRDSVSLGRPPCWAAIANEPEPPRPSPCPPSDKACRAILYGGHCRSARPAHEQKKTANRHEQLTPRHARHGFQATDSLRHPPHPATPPFTPFRAIPGYSGPFRAKIIFPTPATTRCRPIQESPGESQTCPKPIRPTRALHWTP